MKNTSVKKLCALVVAFLLIFTGFTPIAHAQESTTTTEVYTENGCTVTVTTVVTPLASSARSSRSAKTSTKTATITNGTGTTVAVFSITATFSYNGSTATCTSVSHSKTIKNNSWSFSRAISGKSGALATGYYTVDYYQNGTKYNSVSGSIKLSCDKNGHIS